MTHIYNVVEEAKVREVILKSIELDDKGRLSENLEGYRDLNQPQLTERYLSVTSNHLNKINFGDEGWGDTILRVPYAEYDGVRALVYSDYPSAYFFGHKIVLLARVKYMITEEDEIRFIADERSILRPVKYDSSSHGLRFNEVILKELNLDGRNNSSGIFNQVHSDPVQAVFLPVIRFEQVKSWEASLTSSELIDSVREYHNDTLLKEYNTAVNDFLESFQ